MRVFTVCSVVALSAVALAQPSLPPAPQAPHASPTPSAAPAPAAPAAPAPTYVRLESPSYDPKQKPVILEFLREGERDGYPVLWPVVNGKVVRGGPHVLGTLPAGHHRELLVRIQSPTGTGWVLVADADWLPKEPTTLPIRWTHVMLSSVPYGEAVVGLQPDGKCQVAVVHAYPPARRTPQETARTCKEAMAAVTATMTTDAQQGKALAEAEAARAQAAKDKEYVDSGNASRDYGILFDKGKYKEACAVGFKLQSHTHLFHALHNAREGRAGPYEIACALARKPDNATAEKLRVELEEVLARQQAHRDDVNRQVRQIQDLQKAIRKVQAEYPVNVTGPSNSPYTSPAYQRAVNDYLYGSGRAPCPFPDKSAC